MKRSYVNVAVQTAPFLSTITLLSLFGFLLLYGLVCGLGLKAFYLKARFFSISFFCFGGLTWLRVREKLQACCTAILTGVAMFWFACLALFALFHVAEDALNTLGKGTEDVKDYAEVLSLVGYPKIWR